MPQTDILHGDKGYDSNAVRRKIESKGVAPNIPPKANRRWKSCFSPYLYRDRNAIERMTACRQAIPMSDRADIRGTCLIVADGPVCRTLCSGLLGRLRTAYLGHHRPSRDGVRAEDVRS